MELAKFYNIPRFSFLFDMEWTIYFYFNKIYFVEKFKFNDNNHLVKISNLYVSLIILKNFNFDY